MGIAKRISVFLLLALLTASMLSSCKTKREMKKKQQELEQVDNRSQQELEQEYRLAVKRHFAMQSDQTKKMMYETNKRQPGLNSGLERTWYDQLFNSSCFRNSCFVKTGHKWLEVRDTYRMSKSPFMKK